MTPPANTPPPDPKLVDELLEGVVAGQRRSLARAITLVESERVDHQTLAQALLRRALPHTGGAARVGITGTPGVGKSTFVEALGLLLVEQGRRPAVLAVDPSSPMTGGSVLGDKTRMELLSRRPEAFIRPSPSSGALGGVARRTREAMLLCEAAGHDVIIVETVGVGQSEVEVAAMVDTFLLLLQPAGGDGLQGVKRGVLELADAVCINKADGELTAAAARAKLAYGQGLALMRSPTPGWEVPVLSCSALHGEGIDAAWAAVADHRAHLLSHALLDARRADQAERWMWRAVEEDVQRRLASDPSAAALRASVVEEVRTGRRPATDAAQRLVDAMMRPPRPAG